MIGVGMPLDDFGTGSSHLQELCNSLRHSIALFSALVRLCSLVKAAQ